MVDNLNEENQKRNTVLRDIGNNFINQNLPYHSSAK